ncbi:hypothetical protein [Nocardia sp. NPDC046763]|uniref:hypothetical protein n=1 Tax=Nocardia sp. NPDC046763 TaxID=3155256 RepID=UPI0033EF03AF
MTLDRTGEPIDLDDDHDPTRCPKWLGEDADGHPIPCLRCKTHLVDGSHHGRHNEPTPSARAQAAIDAEESRNA